MKLRLLISLILITAVGTTAFASSRALLSDQATLAANTFSTGTVDLQISNSQATSSPNNGSFTDNTTGFTDSILPGATPKTKIFWLRNNSTDVDMTIAAQTASLSGNIDPTKVTVAIAPVDSTGADTAAAVSQTLSQWTSAGTVNSTIVHGGKQRFRMSVSLASDVTTAGNTQFDVIFTGTQTP